jgi:SSS family solute:Na+ symporter
MVVGLGFSLFLLYNTPQISRGVVVKQHFGGSMWALSKWGIDTNASVYIGLITLAVNLLIVVVLTAVFKLLRTSPNLDHTQPEDYTADADIEGLDRLDHLLDGIPQRTGAHALR